VLHTKFAEKIETHFMFNNFKKKKIVSCMTYCGKILYSRTGHRW